MLRWLVIMKSKKNVLTFLYRICRMCFFIHVVRHKDPSVERNNKAKFAHCGLPKPNQHGRATASLPSLDC